MRRISFALLFCFVCLVIVACDTAGPTVPSGVQASGSGATFALADLPPSNPNTAISCPHDAPTQFDVKVDEFVQGKGGWKITVDMRPTSVNISRYVVYYTRRGDAEKAYTIDGRPTDTLYLPLAGIYSFQAQASCGDGLGLRTAPLVRGVGAAVFGPEVPPPPPSPAPPEVPPSK